MKENVIWKRLFCAQTDTQTFSDSSSTKVENRSKTNFTENDPYHVPSHIGLISMSMRQNKFYGGIRIGERPKTGFVCVSGLCPLKF